MGKVKNIRFLIIMAAIVICIVTAFLIRYFSDREIEAFITPTEVELGNSVHFSDSTYNAHSWLWEFGNGDSAVTRSGEYRFKEVGKYMIRVTVDDDLVKKILVNVRPVAKNDQHELVRIIAPQSALQGEYVTFRGEGAAKEWRWEFGESGMVDSRDKSTLYAYATPGIYEVQLTTETTQYPIRHTIEILPDYQANDTTDVLTQIGNDIREKLQAIVDGGSFNVNYNYILHTYLCNNPDVPVQVNHNKLNDFYSYCQGLHLVGRKNTLIDQVVVDLGDSGSDCITQLLVTQFQNTKTRMKK